MMNVFENNLYIFYDYINKDKNNKYPCIIDQNNVKFSIDFNINNKNNKNEIYNNFNWIFSSRESSKLLRENFKINDNSFVYSINRYGELEVNTNTNKINISIAYIEEDKYLSYIFAKSLKWPIPLIYYVGNANEYSLPYLPETCCIKKCHGHSGDSVKCIRNNICVSDYCDYYCKQFGIEEFKKEYSNSKVIIEELLGDEISNDKYNIPCDYRLYVFNGEIEFIFIWKWDEQNYHTKQVACYDKNFKKIENAVNAPYINNDFKCNIII